MAPQICSLLDVDGIRGDMVVNRAAKALVAFEGRDEVTLDDVARVIALCLNHRWAAPMLRPAAVWSCLRGLPLEKPARSVVSAWGAQPHGVQQS